MAVLYAPNSGTPRTLLLHLGPSTCHTVYEAEIAATILALELLCTELHHMLDASIVLDNVATIQASTLCTSGPGHYPTDIPYPQLHTLKRACYNLQLTLQWVPEHCGITGNETTDKAVKEAASGGSLPLSQLPKLLCKPLPLSATRAWGAFKAILDQHAADRWHSSV